MAAYDAFVSYSHVKDKPIAAALQSVIQTLGKPWYRRRALRIFRDDTSLSATPSLWPSIEQALGNSRFLILLASPEAAGSQWVNKEVSYWLDNKGADTLLIALTDGELSWDNANGDFVWRDGMPLPPVLTGRFSGEPKWIDLRAYRDGADARDSRFIEAGADFAAAVHGMPKEDLLSQEVRQQRRALRLAWGAAVTLLVLGGAAGWQWWEAASQRNRAEGVLLAATQNANDLVANAVKLRNMVGIPVDLVGEILGQSERLQEQLTRYSEEQYNPARRQAVTLRERSRTLLLAGDTERALATAQQSRELVEQLVAADRGNAGLQQELSLSFNTIGEALVRAGRTEEALESFRASLAIRRRLAAAMPDVERQRSLALVYDRIGDELFNLKRREEALAAYRNSFVIREKIANADAANPDLQNDLAVSYDRIGRMLSDRDPEALVLYRKSLAIREALVKLNARMLPWQRDLATSYDNVGRLLLAANAADEALATYRKGLAIREILAAADPSSAQLQVGLVVSLVKLAEFNDQSADRYRRALAILDKLADESRLGAGQVGWRAEIERRIKSSAN